MGFFDFLIGTKEEIQAKKELKDKISEIRLKAAKERILEVEQEKAKIQKEIALKQLKEPAKRNSADYLGFKDSFAKFQDFATDFANKPSMFGNTDFISPYANNKKNKK